MKMDMVMLSVCVCTCVCICMCVCVCVCVCVHDGEKRAKVNQTNFLTFHNIVSEIFFSYAPPFVHIS